jgi:hypothetical protein
MAHAYVRYGGDLSGGQQLGREANAILEGLESKAATLPAEQSGPLLATLASPLSAAKVSLEMPMQCGGVETAVATVCCKNAAGKWLRRFGHRAGITAAGRRELLVHIHPTSKRGWPTVARMRLLVQVLGSARCLSMEGRVKICAYMRCCTTLTNCNRIANKQFQTALGT